MQEKKWGSGATLTTPAFTGDVESDPCCLRHYRRRLQRWVAITKEYLPRRCRDAAGKGERRPLQQNGIEILLKDLETSFGEKELFSQGGAIREFENITR